MGQGIEAHLGGHVEMLEPARGGAPDDPGALVRIVESFPEQSADFLDSLGTGDGLTGVFQYQEGIQGAIGARGDDSGIHDIQSQLGQGGGGQGKEMGVIPGIEEDLGAAAGGFLAHQDQRQVRFIHLMDGAGVPGDLVGGMAQEVFRVEMAPDPQAVGGRHALCLEQFQGMGLYLAHQFVLVRRIVQAAAQHALGGSV